MSKPIGPIPHGFAADADGMLLIGGRRADALVAEAGDTPLFVYDLELIDRKVERFRAALPGVALHYAMKANPHPQVVAHLWSRVDGIDLASGGELRTALEAGAYPKAMSFAGPGKRASELELAIRHGVTLNCESEREAARTIAIGERLGLTPRIAIRINPPFEIKGSGMRMGGGARPFGVDHDRVPALIRTLLDAGVDLRGFHIFAGSQALSAEALIEAQGAALDLTEEISRETGYVPAHVNLGGGFGIPYVHGDQPVGVEQVGASLTERLNNRAQEFENTEYAIELGRWLVGECGVYLTRILDRKVSHGKTFLVVDGGMHHQLAASGNFGQVIRRNYPVAIAGRFGAGAEEESSIVGCLCTPLDRLADDVMLPRAEEGDLVAVFLAGAYGLTASPQAFLSQHPAREMVIGGGA
jgi:diaminopimelate decarboxylase